MKKGFKNGVLVGLMFLALTASNAIAENNLVRFKTSNGRGFIFEDYRVTGLRVPSSCNVKIVIDNGGEHSISMESDNDKVTYSVDKDKKSGDVRIRTDIKTPKGNNISLQSEPLSDEEVAALNTDFQWVMRRSTRTNRNNKSGFRSGVDVLAEYVAKLKAQLAQKSSRNPEPCKGR
ncbi:MAG: hypothetical protein GY804_04875 [Alphaproteobacteria bacterium]|nr:hypothetical protein [Alphaproteobacteria bacterium]